MSILCKLGLHCWEKSFRERYCSICEKQQMVFYNSVKKKWEWLNMGYANKKEGEDDGFE